MNSSTTDGSSNATLLRLALLPVILLLLIGLILFLGSVPLGFRETLAILFAGSETEPARTILLGFRIPRAITAVLAGSSLALSGLLMQTYFRNPLAGPGVLGVTSGAGLAVALVVLLSASGGVVLEAGGLPGIRTSLAAVIGAGAVLLLILLVSRFVSSPTTLLVLGVLFGYASSAVVTLLMAGSSAESLQRYIRWSYGSFDVPLGPVTLLLALALLIFGLLSAFLGPRLDVLLLGPRYARTSGVELSRLTPLVLGMAGILTGLTTALCGPIAFLGVAVPHLARLYLGRSLHAVVVPAALLFGAILAVAADILSHLPGVRGVLPVNAVTALIGVPVIIGVILGPTSRRREIEL